MQPTGHAGLGAKVSVGPDWFVVSSTDGHDSGLTLDHRSESEPFVLIEDLSALHAGVKASLAMPPTSPSPNSTVASTLIEGEGGRFQRAGGSFCKTWQGCEKSDYYLYLPIGKVKGPHHSHKSSRLSFFLIYIFAVES